MSYEVSYSKSKGFLKLREKKENGKRKCIRKFPTDTLVRILLTAIESFDEQVEEVSTSVQCKPTEQYEVPEPFKEKAVEYIDESNVEEAEKIITPEEETVEIESTEEESPAEEENQEVEEATNTPVEDTVDQVASEEKEESVSGPNSTETDSTDEDNISI